jgi:hypothetical protein
MSRGIILAMGKPCFQLNRVVGTRVVLLAISAFRKFVPDDRSPRT